MPEVEGFEDRLESAIGQALRDVLVTKWIAVIETIEDDGTRAIYITGSDGLTAWDTSGMLDHALTRERAATAADLLRDMDDG